MEPSSDRNCSHHMSRAECWSALSAQGVRYPPIDLCEWVNQFGNEEDIKLLRDASFSDINVGLSYHGPHLSFPLNASHVQILIDSFTLDQKLHVKYLLQLLHEARLVLKTRPNVTPVSTEFSKRVTVVGDLHGFLLELLTVFEKNGLPDVTNPYVFNGDFVDRGPMSTEVIALLFACLLVWPSGVFLNRGNHEDSSINCEYGFTRELKRKYRQHSQRLITLFNDAFAWLPLATVVDDRILVTHGGVSSNLELRTVNQLERHRFVSLNDEREKASPELEQVMELLWNDPQTERGCNVSDRGSGVLFGPDETQKFLKRHGLSMVVRSHECTPEGFEFCHDRKVLTIFSVSSYSDRNKGALVVFNNTGEPRFVQYKTNRMSLRLMRQRIYRRESAQLRAALKSLDSGAAASTDSQWCSAVMSALLRRCRQDKPRRLGRPPAASGRSSHQLRGCRRPA